MSYAQVSKPVYDYTCDMCGEVARVIDFGAPEDWLSVTARFVHPSRTFDGNLCRQCSRTSLADLASIAGKP
jgi:ribosomal protein L34E